MLQINNYPDDDFAGMYGYEDNDELTSVQSRTGFVITVVNCPVCWVYKLQIEIFLNTMVVEIAALHHNCRYLFLVADIVGLLGSALEKPTGKTKMKVSIHEDNTGSLNMAQTLLPQHISISKHYAIKTVWTRKQIMCRGIKLLKLDTVKQ